MAKKQGNITALYERLSRDDDKFGDSTSIINQKKMLEAYARENGYSNIRHYTDDGYSGGSFERPGWQKMIQDIEDGQISTVIAKDMSRIGRNYLEVGYYTEIFFGQKNIHFIAISNNVDSDDQGSSEFAPFLNIMNEWYLRDCSKKIKASKRSLGNSGVHLAGVPCYGYRKDSNDKHKWLVDEEAAEVIRLIYQLCIDGNGTQQIAQILREREIDTPAYHSAKNGEGRFKNNIEALEPYNWNSGSVKSILSRPEYLGYTVNFRTSSKSYKEKKNIINSPDKWAIFEGTQEPIIDQYTFQLAQKLIGTPRRHDSLGKANPLTGLVFCADCGAKMYNHRAKPFVDRHGKKNPGFDGYDCSTYKLSSRKTTETKCKSHHISTKALREVILFTIRNVCRYAIQDRDGFVHMVRQATEERTISVAEDSCKQHEINIKRFRELDKIYQKLYESFALGIIPENRFRMLADSYEKEQDKLRNEIQNYKELSAEHSDTENDIDRFYDLVDRYTSFEELTPRMLNEFVDKVLVHKAEKIDKKRVQKVEVYLNFIGCIDFPIPEKTSEELEQERIDEYWRERYWRFKDNELARRKELLAEENARINAELQEEREKMIRDFDNKAKVDGLEDLPVIPDRLMGKGQPSATRL